MLSTYVFWMPIINPNYARLNARVKQHEKAQFLCLQSTNNWAQTHTHKHNYISIVDKRQAMVNDVTTENNRL